MALDLRNTMNIANAYEVLLRKLQHKPNVSLEPIIRQLEENLAQLKAVTDHASAEASARLEDIKNMHATLILNALMPELNVHATPTEAMIPPASEEIILTLEEGAFLQDAIEKHYNNRRKKRPFEAKTIHLAKMFIRAHFHNATISRDDVFKVIQQSRERMQSVKHLLSSAGVAIEPIYEEGIRNRHKIVAGYKTVQRKR